MKKASMKQRKDKGTACKSNCGLQAARAVMAAVFLAMISLLVYNLYEYLQGDWIYEGLRKEAAAGGTAVQAEDGEQEADGSGRQIDFAALQRMNPDCVGWINGCDGKIDYPVVLSEDDDYYLTHAVSGERNKAGSIFIDCNTESAFTQFQTILYGHNMKNGSMFHALVNYRDREYWEKHQTITIYLEGETKEYQIFAAYYCSYAALPVYDTAKTEEERKNWLDTVQDMALYNTAVEVNEEDKLLTLITCEYSGEDYRMVVHGKEITETESGKQNNYYVR